MVCCMRRYIICFYGFLMWKIMMETLGSNHVIDVLLRNVTSFYDRLCRLSSPR